FTDDRSSVAADELARAQGEGMGGGMPGGIDAAALEAMVAEGAAAAEAQGQPLDAAGNPLMLFLQSLLPWNAVQAPPPTGDGVD
ncbi:unnamed protein product, partial [Symbiodinium sp. KB8]